MKGKSKKTIFFITGNSYKFQIARDILRGSAIKLVQGKLEVPEIQDESVERVASFSARWACDVLKNPVLVSDGGCYIEALNGFPGPFIKYINKWLSARDLLSIMGNKRNRGVVWKDCLAYCEPGGKTATFMSYFKGKIAKESGRSLYRKKYSWMDTLFIPEKLSRPLSELPDEEYLDFWVNNKNNNSWRKLIKSIK